VVVGTASLDQFRIVYAATYGDLTILSSLRRLGVDLNGMDYDGRTALHLAGSEGQLNVIKYLSSHVEDMLVKDSRRNDALDDA
jgi:glutaminase